MDRRCVLSGPFALALLFALVGCGGGGGGVGGGGGARGFGDQCSTATPLARLEYRTVWASTLPASASQLVEVLDGDGRVVRAEAIDRLARASTEVTLQNVPPGVHEVRATAYPREGATGAPVSRVSTVADFCGDGVTPASVVVQTTGVEQAVAASLQPPSAQVLVQRTRRFVALTLARNGTPAFVPIDSLAWSVSNGVGTVTPDGFFTAVSPGLGEVMATVAGAGTASAPVRVEEFAVRKGKWTVLVYLNAANDLFQFSDLNVNQMERVAGNPDVRFVVQWKQSQSLYRNSTFDGVRRYLVRPDDDMRRLASELVQAGLVDERGIALDMGSPQTLNDFVAWGKEFFPADRYALVVWNHGNGWLRRPDEDRGRAFSYDDSLGTSIKVWEIDRALAGHRFDAIAWDASLMQMLEVAYEAREFADFVVGSQESPPGEGYPYDAVFAAFRDRPDLPTATLTRAFVDGMLNDPRYAGRRITQSVLETGRLGALATALDSLGRALFEHRDSAAAAISSARQQAQAYSPTSRRWYRDLIDLCARLEAAGAPPDVAAAGNAVTAAARDAVVWEGHNAQSPLSNGVSIDFSPGDVFASARGDYIRLKLAKDTFWDEFLGVAP